MSLDVCLIRERWVSYDNGETSETDIESVYDANITHNLNKMAEAAGVYMHLWRPSEIGITKASQLIDPLSKGLKKLHDNPEYYKTFEASNGWGLYEHFVPFVEQYLEACIDYPHAIVHASI